MDPRFRGDDGLRRLDPNAGTTAEWRSYSDDDLAPRMIARHTVDSLGRSVSHNNSTAVTKMIGKITSLIAVQPNLSSSWPEENELTAMLPNMRKSLNACTLLRSSGRWHCVTMVVAPMKAKIPAKAKQHQPGPEMGDRDAGHADDRRRGDQARPMPVMRSTPKRAISVPVMKLGAYIASTCH